MLTVSSREWKTLTTPLEACDRHVIEIMANPALTFGTPRVIYNGNPLSLAIERGVDSLTVTVDDLPGGAVLETPVRAKPPIETSDTTVVVKVDGKTVATSVGIEGAPTFLPERCRWIIDGSFAFGAAGTATLRLSNDGDADAHGIIIAIPTARHFSLAIRDAESTLRDGSVWLVKSIETLAIGERVDIPCELTWADASVPQGEIVAHVEIDGLTVTTIDAPLTYDGRGENTPSIAIALRTDTLFIGRPIIADVTIRNDGTLREAVTCSIDGRDVLSRAINLGALQPLEVRTFPITTELTRAQHRTWDVPIGASLTSPGGTIATTTTKATGAGAAALRVHLDVAESDATLARAITVTIQNIGTGMAKGPMLHLVMAENLVVVADSLMIDKHRKLTISGSVSPDVDLGDIALGQTRIVTLSVRSFGAYTGAITARVDYDDVVASDVSEPVAFSDGATRSVAAEPVTPPAVEASDTIATDQIVRDAVAAEGQPEAQAASTAAISEKLPDVASPADLQTANPQPDETKVEPNLYRDSLTDAFIDLIPEEGDIILGRAILALYDYLPLRDEACDAELTDLRNEASAIVERYLPSVKGGTFGASGYALTTIELGGALLRFERKRDGKSAPADRTDRDVMLTVLGMTGAEGTIKDDIERLRTATITALTNVPDEESLGDPISLPEAAAA